MKSFDEECCEIDELVEKRSKRLVDTVDFLLECMQAVKTIKPKSDEQIIIEQMQKNTVQQNKILKRLMKDRHYKKKGFKQWVLASEEQSTL